MNLLTVLKSRTALVLLAGILYVSWKSLARHFGLDDAASGMVTDSIVLGNGGLALVWAFGHCDGLDGPVVTAARKALDSGQVNLVLPWVRAEDEAEVRQAFAQASAVRKLGAEARQLADTHFFETLVRIHRAGEGAPFTGLKPAGRDPGPAIPAADQALETGSIEQVQSLLSDAIHRGVRQHFEAALAHKKFSPHDIKAGREYVAAYVPYVHYVERLWEAAQGGPHAPEQHHARHGH